MRAKVGEDYDFIDKVVRPRYEYSTTRKQVTTVTVTSAADGRFDLTVTVPDASHVYEVVLKTTDDGGRVQTRTLMVGQPVELPWWIDSGPVFEQADGTLAGSTEFGVGGQVAWQITDARSGGSLGRRGSLPLHHGPARPPVRRDQHLVHLPAHLRGG